MNAVWVFVGRIGFGTDFGVDVGSPLRVLTPRGTAYTGWSDLYIAPSHYKEGADAVLVNCVLEPGVEAAREVVQIPVVGPAAAFHLAATLGHRILIVTVLARLVPLVRYRASLYGLGNRLASIRSLEIPVLELGSDWNSLVAALTMESKLAVDLDKADTIVLGCTGMTKATRDLTRKLHDDGYNVPIVDPLAAALKLAETLVDLRLSHSKVAYPQPKTRSCIVA